MDKSPATNFDQSHDVLLPVVEALEQIGIPYVIGGSVASSSWGFPRSTNDADVVADIKPEQVAPLVALLNEDFYMDAQAIHEAIRRRGTFNIIHYETVFKVDIFIRKDTPFADAEFAHARPRTLNESSTRLVTMSSPENTVLHKLLWYQMGGGISERQWLDVLAVLKVRGPELDQIYMREWAERLGVTPLLDQALSEAGDEE